MKKFTYTVQERMGIHARPAGQLVKMVLDFSSKCFLEVDGKKTELNSLMGIMNLDITCGSIVNISAEGEDEDQAIRELQEFFFLNV